MRSIENGRSMVEMLGVLAIIGVLSLTGLMGYTTAMAKHRANEAVNAVSMAFSQMGTSGTPEFITVSGVTFESKSVAGVGDNAYLELDVDDVKVCKQIKMLLANNDTYVVTGECE